MKVKKQVDKKMKVLLTSLALVLVMISPFAIKGIGNLIANAETPPVNIMAQAIYGGYNINLEVIDNIKEQYPNAHILYSAERSDSVNIESYFDKSTVLEFTDEDIYAQNTTNAVTTIDLSGFKFMGEEVTSVKINPYNTKKTAIYFNDKLVFNIYSTSYYGKIIKAYAKEGTLENGLSYKAIRYEGTINQSYTTYKYLLKFDMVMLSNNDIYFYFDDCPDYTNTSHTAYMYDGSGNQLLSFNTLDDSPISLYHQDEDGSAWEAKAEEIKYNDTNVFGDSYVTEEVLLEQYRDSLAESFNFDLTYTSSTTYYLKAVAVDSVTYKKIGTIATSNVSIGSAPSTVSLSTNHIDYVNEEGNPSKKLALYPSCSTSDVDIYYTLNISDTVSSYIEPDYNNPSSNGTILYDPSVNDGYIYILDELDELNKYYSVKAIALKPGCAIGTYRTTSDSRKKITLNDSKITLSDYTYNQKRLLIYIKNLECNSSCNIYYTTDGTDPTTSSKKFTYYSGSSYYYYANITASDITSYPVKILVVTTSGYYDTSSVYEYPLEFEQLEKPIISQYNSDDNYNTYFKIEMPEGATAPSYIYYTTDGTDPLTSSTKVQYTAPVVLTSDVMNIRAVARKSGYIDSEISEKTVTFDAEIAPVEITLEYSSHYNNYSSITSYLNVKIKATCATKNTTIYYTMDGTEPTTNSTKFVSYIDYRYGYYWYNDVTYYNDFIKIDDYKFKAFLGNSESEVIDYHFELPKADKPTFTREPIIGGYKWTFNLAGYESISKKWLFEDYEYKTLDGYIEYITSNPHRGCASFSSNLIYEDYILTGTLIGDINSYDSYDGSTDGKITYTKAFRSFVLGYAPSDFAYDTVVIEPTPSPTITAVDNGDNTLTITMECEDDTAEIYYSTSKTNPQISTANTTKYTGPFTVSSGKTIAAIAYGMGKAGSYYTTVTAKCGVVADPVITIANTENGKKATITSATSGATIYYTTDGTEPTTASKVYSGAISLTSEVENLVIKAIAVKTTLETPMSAVVTSSPITITKTQNPVVEVEEVDDVAYVTLSTPTENAKIYYTTNGSTPTSSSTEYTGEILITKSCTLKAIAICTGSLKSGVVSETLSVGIPLPQILTENYYGGKTIVISKVDPDSLFDIYYTLDGTTPTLSSKKYVNPIYATTTTTVNAICVMRSTNLATDVVTKTVTVEKTPTPTITTNGYEGGQSVVIDCSDAKIYYTTDGTTPNIQSKIYYSVMKFTEDTTLKAFAVKLGYAYSKVSIKDVDVLDAEAPVITSTVSSNDKTYAVITAEEGYKIYYTTNGSTPTLQSAVYSSPVLLTRLSTTVKAITVKAGSTLSDVAESIIELTTIPAPQITTTDVIGGKQVSITVPVSGVSIYYTTDGTEPTTNSQLYTGSFLVDKTTNIKAIAVLTSLSSENALEVTVEQVATPVVSYDKNTKKVTLTCDTPGATIQYILNGVLKKYSSPFILNNSEELKAYATLEGWATSKKVGLLGIYPEINSISSAMNTTEGNAVVTITATNDAIIYYTINGSTPTNQSILYTGPFTVTSACTVKAIAYNKDDSSLFSAIKSSYVNVSYSIIYNGNAANVTNVPEEQIISGTNASLSSQVPIRKNYYFYGWAKTPNYQPGDVYWHSGNTYTDGPAELFAIWTEIDSANQNIINYQGKVDVNEVISTLADVDFGTLPVCADKGATIDLSAFTPVKRDFIFVGWYTDESCTTPVSNLTSYSLNAETTLYAKFIPLGSLESSSDDKNFASYKTNNAFEMYGVSIRMKNNRGMRYMTRISKDLLDRIEAETGSAITDYGSILAKKTTFENNAGNTTKFSKRYANNGKFSDFDNYFVYTTLITNMTEASYQTDYIMVPFIEYKDIHGMQRTYNYYEDTKSSSNTTYYSYFTNLKKVANAFLSQNLGFNDEERSWLNGIINSTAN